MRAKIVEVSLTDYKIDSKPDYIKLGAIVDKAIEENFNDGLYGIRAIGKDDHRNFTLDELVNKILTTGTDKYDPNKKSVCHDQFSVYDYDIQMGTFEIKNSKLVNCPDDLPGLFAETIYNFYEHTPLDRGYSVRIDLLLIYDLSKLKLAKKTNIRDTGIKPGLENYLYKFVDRKNKPEALLGIVKILR
ncbi:hypothetical protein KKD37_03945 [Patescibacteria group bacterium]|nr:hypothetical protein [Patescibacteria group bacterium]